MKDFQVFLSLFRSLLTFFYCRSLLITSFHVFPGCQGNLPLILKVHHLPDQALSLILSRLPNHCSLLTCNHSLIFFNFRLVISSCLEILSSSLPLHIHLNILVSFFSILITPSFSTGQVSFSYSVTPHEHVEYNLSFSPKSKALWANKDTKSLDLFHPLLILVITLSNHDPPLSPILSQR